MLSRATNTQHALSFAYFVKTFSKSLRERKISRSEVALPFGDPLVQRPFGNLGHLGRLVETESGRAGPQRCRPLSQIDELLDVALRAMLHRTGDLARVSRHLGLKLWVIPDNRALCRLNDLNAGHVSRRFEAERARR